MWIQHNATELTTLPVRLLKLRFQKEKGQNKIEEII